MNLGFKQTFPWGEPTYFREKILLGAGYGILRDTDEVDHVIKPTSIHLQVIYSFGQIVPKLHTFREDKHDRWKAGRTIQMVYRGKNYSIKDHFNKDTPELQKCVSTQKIEIVNGNHLSHIPKKLGFMDCIIVRGVEFHNLWMVSIDGVALVEEDIIKLAINDGFEDAHHFFKWFNKDWEGKIIHWSSLRY